MPISRALQAIAKAYLGDHTKVRDCPFCGGDDLSINEVDRNTGKWYCICCAQCKTMGPQGRDESGCLAMWQGAILEGSGIIHYAKRRMIRVRRPHGSRSG